jgi:hypothetical protein
MLNIEKWGFNMTCTKTVFHEKEEEEIHWQYDYSVDILLEGGITNGYLIASY